jgi:hypothetical protein
LEFRIQGIKGQASGYGFEGKRFKVWNLGVRVRGLEFTVQVLWFVV